MKALKYLLSITLILLAGIQFYPVERSNPEGSMEVPAPAEVRAVLQRSCYDCHSFETKWPWYSYVAPASWLVIYDVEEGRSELNFSTWDKYSSKKREKLIEEVWEEAHEGEMPLWTYLIAHPDARLSDKDIEVLRSWQKPPGEKLEDAILTRK